MTYPHGLWQRKVGQKWNSVHRGGACVSMAGRAKCADDKDTGDLLVVANKPAVHRPVKLRKNVMDKMPEVKNIL